MLLRTPVTGDENDEKWNRGRGIYCVWEDLGIISSVVFYRFIVVSMAVWCWWPCLLLPRSEWSFIHSFLAICSFSDLLTFFWCIRYLGSCMLCSFGVHGIRGSLLCCYSVYILNLKWLSRYIIVEVFLGFWGVARSWLKCDIIYMVGCI